MQHIKMADITAYISLFKQHDVELFVELMYAMDDVEVNYEIKKHNKEMDKLKK